MDRILKVPPLIKPVAAGIERPLWSVMIPTYNCFRYIRQTLESVLSQDPGPELMQIQVVDDCSTDGDLEALINEIGKGRVEFYRQEKNVGHHKNFETCLNNSRGKYIHLLHGDDCVQDGFYTEIENLFETYPQAGAAFTKNGYLDDWNNMWIPEHSIMNQSGIISDFLFEIAQKQMLQVVAMVVKRNVYEELGGFYAVNYCEDWEMWIRIAAHYPVAYSPATLALYRTGHGNVGSITSTALLNGDNFENIKKAISLTQKYFPPDKRRYIKNRARKNYSMQVAKASYKMYEGSRKIAFKQAIGALKLDMNIRSFYWFIRLCILHFQRISGRNTTKQPQVQLNTSTG